MSISTEGVKESESEILERSVRYFTSDSATLVVTLIPAVKTFCFLIRPELRTTTEVKRIKKTSGFGKVDLCLSILTQFSPNRPSVCTRLRALPVVVLAMPANSSVQANYAKSAKYQSLKKNFE